MTCGRSQRNVRTHSLLRKHLKKVHPIIELGFCSSSVEVCEERWVRSAFQHPKSEASTLIDLTTRSAKKLVV